MTTLKSITLKGYIANWDKKNKERSWDPINPHGTRKEMNNINGLNLKNPEQIYQIILQELVNIPNVSNSSACLILGI